MRLQVVAVGKLRDPAVEALCDRYLRRLQPLFPVEVVEIRDHAELGRRWGRQVGTQILLDERGREPSSRELAAAIGDARGDGCRQLTYYIGGAEGFSDEERQRADGLLALSRLTLPHRLARLLLLEQLYRAATILAGHPYHND